MDYRDRLQRPKAINAPKQAHELTFSCYLRYPFLSKDRACGWLSDAIDHARPELDFALWAYVFMPEHVHLLIDPRRADYDAADFLKLVMIDYIHMNPVRRKLVSDARDWKWSSAGWYADAPLNNLKPDPIPYDWLEL